mmetsp:Transcript_64526/g.154117  ORF Transcript_64526/g.154117 Transcript_64526/m.154117 type:complete len:345 (-) Transcript_64526:36-1070(-)
MRRDQPLVHAVYRACRRFLLSQVMPPITKSPLCALSAIIGTSVLTGILLALLILPPLPFPGRRGGSARGLRGADKTIELLVQDFQLHSSEHWRMLFPSPGRAKEGFIAELANSLRARPLQRPSLDFALDTFAASLTPDSLWLEFGVWTGRSLNLIGKQSSSLGRKRKVFGFDSFKGLPEHWRNGSFGEAWAKRWTAKGAFDLGGEPPKFFVDTDAVDFVVGWFNESLPAFLSRESGPISFVHIDSDLYSSASTVLNLITPRLQSGAVLVFDELINYPGFEDGEVKALYEWLESEQFGQSGLSAVQVVGYPGPELLTDAKVLSKAIKKQKGEGRHYPQDVVLRVW